MSDAGGSTWCRAACYGYPISHSSRGANELFLADVLTFLGGLTCPSVMMGDVNDHPTTSFALTQAHGVGMHRLTRDEATTLTKDGQLASKPPIDQCYGNQPLLDLGVKVKVDPTLRISDHLPVLLQVNVVQAVQWCVKWSSPTKDLPRRVHDIPWEAMPITFDQWQDAACEWLSNAHQHEIQPGKEEYSLTL